MRLTMEWQVRSPGRIAVIIFLAVATLLVAVHGNRVVATNDEGILLDAAQRVAAGQRPYVDFWAYMSPGSYWLQGAVFRLFGVSLLTGRLIVILDFSLQCALIFWLATRLAPLGTAFAVTFAYLGFQIADPTLLTAQHRWDSSTFALVGVAIACSTTSRYGWIASGAVLAAAAWCTPTVGLVLLMVALWLLFQPDRRLALIPLLAGAAVVFAGGTGWLAEKGCLAPLIHQMLWLRQNYIVNAMPYGAIIGGYRALFHGLSGALDLGIRVLLVGCVALPAILPPLALLAWATLLWRKKVPDQQRPIIVLLLLAMGAIVLALSPRPDVMHLAFVSALPYLLAGAALSRLIPVRARVPLAVFTVLMSTIFASNSFNTLRTTSRVASPVGNLRVDNAQQSGLRHLLATVRPGEPLFVYPYMPMHYFLTQAHNPTDFSFFSPGMATKREASAALTELQARPPEWVLFMKISREEYLRVVPSGASAEWRYEELENWLEQNYSPVEKSGVVVYGYQLRRRAYPATTARY
jgi:4-amino-4-deoxy-L-arabinose transferase-like glycosyltransferase